MYGKIAKWVAWILIVISVAIIVWGFVGDFQSQDGLVVDVLLMWGFVLLITAVALVVLLGLIFGIVNNPKSLIKLGISLIIACVITLIAYLLASGDPLQAYIGTQPEENILKLTDTLLNITYILGAGAIISIVLGEIVNTVRK